MTSEPTKEVFVWCWLAGATEPVVAGLITRDSERYIFNYGRSYLERKAAIPLYEPELPLRRGAIPPYRATIWMRRATIKMRTDGSPSVLMIVAGAVTRKRFFAQ